MNKSYAFTGRSINFWLGLLTLLQLQRKMELRNFCKTEYGTDWQWAYSHYQKNKSFPSPLKEALMNSIFKTLPTMTVKKEKDSKVLNRDELYLAGSADLFDLERRQKEIDTRFTRKF